MPCRRRADGKVFDYVGGLDDIAARRVRFIGEPQQRIAEDYLRILRFFRFHAYFAEGAPDAAGLHACIVARDGLDTLSRERVRMELLKLFVAPRAAPTLTVMAESGLLVRVLGGVPYVANFAKLADDRNGCWQRARSGAPAWRARRHGARGRRAAVTAPAAVQRRIRTARRARRLVADLAVAERTGSARPALSTWSAIFRRPCAARLGAGRRPARPMTPGAALSLPQRWTAPEFPLKSADFTRRGVPTGPALGAAMRAARDAWIAADFPKDRATIEAIADDAARDATSGD